MIKTSLKKANSKSLKKKVSDYLTQLSNKVTKYLKGDHSFLFYFESEIIDTLAREVNFNHKEN